MKQYKNIEEYLASQGSACNKREDIKEIILQSALSLLCNCAHNFEGDAQMTERISEPLYILNEILDKVE